MPHVDVQFPVTGTKVPLDHAYALFSALSREIPKLHERKDLGVFNLRGMAVGNALHLRSAFLRIRCPAEVFGLLIPLAGKTLQILDSKISLGVPVARPLTSPTSLSARIVTIKKFMEAPEFEIAATRHLKEMGVEGTVHVGRRRVLAIAGAKVVGFALVVSGLSPEGSLRLQEQGLGGRRHMGCGLFLPTDRPVPRDLAVLDSLPQAGEPAHP